MSYLPPDDFDVENAETLSVPTAEVFSDGYEIADFLRYGETPAIAEFIDQNRSQFQAFFDHSLQNGLDLDLLIDGLDCELDEVIDQCRHIINKTADKYSPYLDKVFFTPTAPIQVLSDIVESPVGSQISNASLEIPQERKRKTPLDMKKWARAGGTGSLLAAASFAGFMATKNIQSPPEQPSSIHTIQHTLTAIQTTYDLAEQAVPYAIQSASEISGEIVQEFQTASQILENASLIVREQYPTSYYNPFLIHNLENNPENLQYVELITEAALQYGLNPIQFANQIFRESAGFNADVIEGRRYSGAGAVGIAQIMPSTARERGLTIDDLLNPRTAIFEGAEIMAEKMVEYSDQMLAAVAYNGGDGAVRFPMEELGVDNISYQEWIAFNQDRRIERGTNNPSAWHVETYEYAQFIDGSGWEIPHRQWSRQQQSEGLPLHMANISLMIADHHGTLDTSNTLVAGLISSKPEISTM